jgi:hypothetical protein
MLSLFYLQISSTYKQQFSLVFFSFFGTEKVFTEQVELYEMKITINLEKLNLAVFLTLLPATR